MFDWIPLASYTPIFYYLMLGVSLFVAFHSQVFDLRNTGRIKELRILGMMLMILIIFYMGLRPVSAQYFGDMGPYSKIFLNYQMGMPYKQTGDVFFHRFVWLCAQIMSAKSFFLLVDVIYILPMFFFSRKYFRTYWFFGLFMFFASFSFWSYGTNGIRNGMATSLFLLGLCFYERRKLWMYLLFVLAYLMHASLIIPIAAFVGAKILLRKPAYMIGIWLAAIPLSLFAGGSVMNFMEGFGLFEDRIDGYLTGQEEYMEQFSQTGFRWDFLLYSSTAVFAGWYYIFKLKVQDTFYTHLYGIYLLANAFWIIVIRAAFSNRFAYLSWFLMAAVIVYPLARYKLMHHQYKILGGIVLVYFLFTYLMNVIL